MDVIRIARGEWAYDLGTAKTQGLEKVGPGLSVLGRAFVQMRESA